MGGWEEAGEIAPVATVGGVGSFAKGDDDRSGSGLTLACRSHAATRNPSHCTIGAGQPRPRWDCTNSDGETP